MTNILHQMTRQVHAGVIQRGCIVTSAQLDFDHATNMHKHHATSFHYLDAA